MQKAILFLLPLLLLGCPDTTPGPTGPVTKYHDTFDSFTMTQWTQFGSGTWSTTSDAGNAVLTDTDNDFILYNGYTGSDYTVSARIKPIAATGYNEGVSAREVSNTFYSLTIYGASAPAVLMLTRYNSGSGTNLASSNYLNTLSTSQWYTLTLKVQGTNITGQITDGTNTTSLSFDDGASALASGGAGLLEMSSVHGSYFDDFTITEP